MKNIIAITTIALSACSAAPSSIGEQAPAQEQFPVAGIAPASGGLSDLNALTFSYPQAGLNAAAREAAKVPTRAVINLPTLKSLMILTIHFTKSILKATTRQRRL